MYFNISMISPQIYYFMDDRQAVDLKNLLIYRIQPAFPVIL
ncbi:hypothetical protein DOT_1665 [Desulfosporosinus sp. OT]|nr:hypothetical protein DOT_1665 [Desulfosporosinus sp. OT]